MPGDVQVSHARHVARVLGQFVGDVEPWGFEGDHVPVEARQRVQ